MLFFKTFYQTFTLQKKYVMLDTEESWKEAIVVYFKVLHQTLYYKRNLYA